MRDAFLDIHFHFELPEDNWPKSFSVLTAYNPFNERLTDDENRVVNNDLFDELTLLPQVFKVMLGSGAHMKNSEPGFGCGARLHTLLEMADRWGQFGLYLVVGDQLSLVPCTSDSDEIVIPGGFRKRVIKSNTY